jgi:hypothetical protein
VVKIKTEKTKMETMTKRDMAILITRAATGEPTVENIGNNDRINFLLESSREELSYLAHRAARLLKHADPVEVELVVHGPNVNVFVYNKIFKVFTCPSDNKIVWFRGSMIEWLNAHNYKVVNKNDFSWSNMLEN